MIALPALPTPAAHGTPDRDTQPVVDRRRIGELDADYTRLHRAMARSLTQSLRTYAGDLKAGTPAHHAAKAFVQRHTHLLSTAYDLAHYEGQRDYHETVSLRPRELALVEPDATLRARRLAFYLPSVTKMAREGAEAARERRLSPVTAMLDERMLLYNPYQRGPHGHYGEGGMHGMHSQIGSKLKGVVSHLPIHHTGPHEGEHVAAKHGANAPQHGANAPHLKGHAEARRLELVHRFGEYSDHARVAAVNRLVEAHPALLGALNEHFGGHARSLSVESVMAHAKGMMTHEQAHAALGHLHSLSEWSLLHSSHVNSDGRLTLFHGTHGRDAKEVLRELSRGKFHDGISFSSDERVSRDFAYAYRRPGEHARVFRAEVPASAVLAHDGLLKGTRAPGFQSESEFILGGGAKLGNVQEITPHSALAEGADGYNTNGMTLATVPQGDAVDDWLDGLGVRVDLQAGIAWPGLQDGYVKGGAADNANPFSLVYWVLEPLAQHCHDCPAFAAASPYNAPGSGGNELWIAPGDGTSECGTGCRCSLSYEPDTSDEALNIANAQQAYASWLPRGMPPSFAGEGGREVLLKTFAPRLGAQPGPLLDGQKRALDALRGAMADWDTVRGAYPSAPNFFAGTLGAENPAYSIPVDWARLTKAQQRVILRLLAALDAWDFWTQEAWLNAPDEGGQGDVELAEDDAGGDGERMLLSNPYPRGPHGHFGEGGEHGMHGSHIGEGRGRGRGASVHAHVAAAHHDGPHEGKAGGGGSAHGEHGAQHGEHTEHAGPHGGRPFTEHEFGAALKGMRVLPHGQQGMMHSETGIVKMNGQQFHVKAFSHEPLAEQRLGHELASKEIAHTVGLGAHVPRGWMVEHEGTPYLVSERAPGHSLRALAEHRYPKPEPGHEDPRFEERGKLEQRLLLRSPEATRGAIWLHEYVTANGDAHDGNLMVHAKSGHLTSIDHELSFASHGAGVSHFSAVATYSTRDTEEGKYGLKLPRATMESYVKHASDIVRIAEDHHIDPGPVIARLQVLHNVLRDTPADHELTVRDVDMAARAFGRQARGQ